MTNTLTAKDDLSFLCVCDDVTQVSRVLEALHFKMPGTTAKRVHHSFLAFPGILFDFFVRCSPL